MQVYALFIILSLTLSINCDRENLSSFSYIYSSRDALKTIWSTGSSARFNYLLIQSMKGNLPSKYLIHIKQTRASLEFSSSNRERISQSQFEHSFFTIKLLEFSDNCFCVAQWGHIKTDWYHICLNTVKLPIKTALMNSRSEY